MNARPDSPPSPPSSRSLRTLPIDVAGQPVWGLLSVLAFLVTMPMTCTPVSHALRVEPTPQVGVLLGRDQPEFELRIDGPFEVLDGSGRRIASGPRLSPGVLRAQPDKVELNGIPLADTVILRPRGDGVIQVSDHRYHGDLRVARTGRKLEVSNVLDLESYVAGVLFSEMPASFPREALRAQAVASRSYAFDRIRQGDLLAPTDADQVYGGVSSRAAYAAQIVASTKGEVLEEGGEVIRAYFSSTCGGATGSAKDVFLEPGRRALSGVRCEWCKASPRYRWSRSLPQAELARRLGLRTTTITSIRRRTDDFGRALEFRVLAPDVLEDIPGLHFRSRWNVGASGIDDQLLSPYLLDLRLDEDQVFVDGAGWGHGVGMCQYGCSGLAKSGRDYREILAYYYTDAQLVQRW